MTIEIADHGYRYITRDDELGDVLEVIGSSKVLGIDTESDSLFSYRESCCLIQITGDSGPDFIIDPLSVRDLSALAPLMEDPDITKIFHGADFDIVSMKRDFGFRFCNIFDTMIAAQAVGHDRFGLFDLASHYFGVTLNKKYQRHDWSSRPLKEEHLNYARLDSHFLPKLMELLSEQAVENGRSAMLSEEFGLLESREWTGREYQPDDCIRIKGATKLEADQLRVLRAVCNLRDQIASDRNRPSFKVWSNDTCIKLAMTVPVDRNELRKALGDNHHVVRRYAREVTAAVSQGKVDESAPPKAPKNSRKRIKNDLPAFTREHEKLLTHLRKWRNRTSEETKLGPGMIVNNAVLKGVAALQPSKVSELSRIPEIRRWQIKDWGEALVTQVAEFEASKETSEKSSAADGDGNKKRRRRRRGGRGRDKSNGDTAEANAAQRPAHSEDQGE